MVKILCEGCGEEMMEVYTKKGLRLYVCMHNKATVVNNRMGRPRFGVIYCGNDVFGLKSAFENLTKDTQLTINNLKDATENKIDAATLYKFANLALQLNLDAKLDDLFNAAMTLGYSLGITPEKSIESLVTGIARKSRLMLDNIGVIFVATEAYEWYSKQAPHLTLLPSGQPALTNEQKDVAWKQYAIHKVKQQAQRVKT